MPLSCASPNEVLVYDCYSRTINSTVTLSLTNTSSRIPLSYTSSPVGRIRLILDNSLSLSSICLLNSGGFVTNVLRLKPPSANPTLDLCTVRRLLRQSLLLSSDHSCRLTLKMSQQMQVPPLHIFPSGVSQLHFGEMGLTTRQPQLVQIAAQLLEDTLSSNHQTTRTSRHLYLLLILTCSGMPF